MMKILVGEISSYKAIVIARFIKNNYKDVSIYTYDKKKRSNLIRSKYSDKHYYINPRNFENEIQTIIKEQNIDFFFPVINNSLSILFRDKQRYGNSLDYLGDMEPYNVLNNKLSLIKLANRFNIKTPKVYKRLEDAVIPFVVKPTNLSSAIGVKYVFNESDIGKVKEKTNKENIFIQEYVEGIGVGYSFYCDQGKIVHGYGHMRLAEYPVTGGSSTSRTYYHNNLMHELASTIVEELNYTGFAMFEFKLNSNNELILIEVNPRIWGSINQGLTESNVNYFEKILGKSTKDNNFKKKYINTYIAPLIYISLIKYIFKLEFRPVRIFLGNFLKNRSDVGMLRDPLGYLSTIFRKL